MATRSGTSFGVLASLVVFALLALVFFALAVVFIARAQTYSRELDTARQDLREAVANQDDRWEELRNLSGRQSVVSYLDEQNAELLRLIGLPARLDAETARTRAAQRLDEEEINDVLSEAQSLRRELSRVRAELSAAEDAARLAAEDRDAAIARLERVREQNAETVASLRSEIDRYRQQVEAYRADVEQTQGAYDDQIASVRGDLTQRIAQLVDERRDLAADLLVAREQLNRLRGDTARSTLSGSFEGALVDGRVIEVAPATSEVAIDLGRRDNLVLGMTFEVYGRDVSVRPDAEGVFPPGKATIEVTRIDERTGRARVIRSVSGSPILQNDKLVNAVYDPNKTYKFAVFGNFDTNDDGVATTAEADAIRGYIQEWGGEASDDIAGDTDFLVLGQPPVLPPQPPFDAPREVIQRFLDLQARADKYDEMFDAAQATNIPVLNQNRFMTLTGLDARR